jgi:hypothetical protein
MHLSQNKNIVLNKNNIRIDQARLNLINSPDDLNLTRQLSAHLILFGVSFLILWVANGQSNNNWYDVFLRFSKPIKT